MAARSGNRRRSIPAVLEFLPTDSNVVAGRCSTPLFGFGLIEAIPDFAIIRNVSKPKCAGIRGRASMVVDVTTGNLRVGRVGWKEHATLLAFSADAYLNE